MTPPRLTLETFTAWQQNERRAMEKMTREIEQQLNGRDKRNTMNQRKDAQQGGMGFGFETPNQGETVVWLTPPHILKALGDFDLDPCAPLNRPWDTARWHLTVEDDGLKTDWGGGDVRTYCNPPYGATETPQWMRKMAEHGNGIALIFARVETLIFHQHIFPTATGFLFLQSRLKFYRPDGTEGACATAPSVLISFDNEYSQGRNFTALIESGLRGALFGPAHMIGNGRSVLPQAALDMTEYDYNTDPHQMTTEEWAANTIRTEMTR